MPSYSAALLWLIAHHLLGWCALDGPQILNSCPPEDLQQGLVQEPVDVLDMVVRLVGSLDLLLGLTWVDALQDAQPPATRVEMHADEHMICAAGVQACK